MVLSIHAPNVTHNSDGSINTRLHINTAYGRKEESLQITTKIDRIGDRMVERGLRLKEMAADGRIDQDELLELLDIADNELTESVEVESIGLDIQEATQILRLGSENSPERRLQDRRKRLETLRMQRSNQFKMRLYESKTSAPVRMVAEAKATYAAKL